MVVTARDNDHRAGRRRAGVALACAALVALSACASTPAVEILARPTSGASATPAGEVSASPASEVSTTAPGELSSTWTEAAPYPSADNDMSTVTSIRAFITGYSYFDNTPPGSARISHPVLHSVAGGRGTYDDPITVAVGHVREGGVSVLDWPAGTRFYVPNLRRYLIVEDTCGDGERPQDGPCHTGYPAGSTTWLDVWIGGEGGTQAGAERCMRKITGVWDVIVDPGPGYPVAPGEIYAPTDAGRAHSAVPGCTNTYGNEI